MSIYVWEGPEEELACFCAATEKIAKKAIF